MHLGRDRATWATAVYSLDHRLRAPRNSGSVVWFVEDLEEGGYTEAAFGPSVLVPVAAR